MPVARRDRLALVALAVALFASYAWFYEAGGWNQNSRFDFVRAVVFRGTMQIDAYADNTGDKAVFEGHTYSDKAPGLSLTAIPIVKLAVPLVKRLGMKAQGPDGLVALSYVATVVCSGLVTVWAALLLVRAGHDWFGLESAGWFAALVYGLGTPAWAYATLFMGHALTATLLFVAYLEAWRISPVDAPSIARRRGLAVGLACGWATVTDMTTAIPAVVLTLFALRHVGTIGVRGVRPAAIGVAVGALACIAVLVGYNLAAFGSPLHIGYASEEGFGELKSGFFGITYPKWSVIGELLAKGDERRSEVDEIVLPVLPLPVVPRDPVVLAVGVVVARLRATELIAAADHRHPGGEEQGREEVAHLPVAQFGDGGIVGLAFDAVVARTVVVGAVAIVLEVRLIVLVLVGHHIA